MKSRSTGTSTDVSTKERYLIVDGLNNFVRNFCVNPTLDVNGMPIGGTIGFVRTLKHVMREVRPTRVIVAWDGKGGSAKRRSVYGEYKAGRKPRLNREYGDDESVDDSRENMRHQYAKVREYLTLLGVAQVEVESCEADDLIGYLCSSVYTDVEKVVMSTDRDFLQLVDQKTVIYSPTKKILYTKKNFVELVGVLPENYIYVKSIVGDTSDNIRGVKGVGEKTLIKSFPFLAERQTSLEEIFGAAETQREKSAKCNALLLGREVVSSNLQLMQLRSPTIGAHSVRSIRHQVRDDAYVFNFSDFKLTIIRDGIQLTDTDFFIVFGEYKLRFTRGDQLNV